MGSYIKEPKKLIAMGKKKKNTKVMDVYFQSNPAYTVQHETFDGKDHLVVPVVLMVEGVHSGSHGAILHTAQELGAIEEAWNDIPVTLGHPKIGDEYVSATSPEVLTDWAVGNVYNVYMDGTSLKGEAWIDVAKLEALSASAFEKISNGEIMEVSVGVISEEEQTSGEFEGENYIAIAKNYRPNHLALLPDEIGACSIEDGCGLRVNQKKGGTKVTDKKLLVINEENRLQVLKQLNEQGFSVNAMGFREGMDKARDAIYGMDGNAFSYYLEEMYDATLVYRAHNYSVNPSTTQLFEQSYQENAAGEIELTGEAVQVKRTVTYDAVPNVNSNVKRKRKYPVNNNAKNEKGMSECTDCVQKLATALINNKGTAWVETDRVYLEGQSEDQLEKMTPAKEPQVNSSSKMSRKEILAELGSAPLSTQEFLATASPEVKEQVLGGIQANADKKAALVTGILANAEAWTEEELKLKSIAELTKLHQTVNKDDVAEQVSFGTIGGQTIPQVNAKDEDYGEPMLDQTIEFVENK